MSINKSPKYIVVVGASAGGLNSVAELCAQLTKDMDLSVLIVLHITHMSMPAGLIQRLQSNTGFHCKIAEHEETIKSQCVYMAVPGKHLLVKDNKIILGEGATENRWRPSIDVLFRSAAVFYNARCIGIILSGLLQDGMAGMQAIKKCGGTTIVQDPTETEYPDMALSVLNSIEVDYCVHLLAMGSILHEKTRNGLPEPYIIPAELKREAEIAERVAIKVEDLKDIGEKSLFSCPDCGGGLWEIVSENVIRYRCHTGHVFTQNELVIRQSESLENTLWVALRMLEERFSLLQKIALEEELKGWQRMADQKRERAKELRQHIERLKDILYNTEKDPKKIEENLYTGDSEK